MTEVNLHVENKNHLRWRWFGACAFVAASIAAIWLLPEALVNWSTRAIVDPLKPLSSAEFVKAVTDARQGVLFSVGGCIAIFTLLISLSKHNLDRRSQELDRERQELDRDANRTNRYTEAVKQLGAESSPSIRLGGIYALERIAQDSPRDRQTILDVLCAFARERSSVAKMVGANAVLVTDVAAAVTVFGRRKFLDSNQVSFDLSRTYLGGIRLSNACLAYTNFGFSNLAEAQLDHANLTRVTLLNANLVRANLFSASLRSANLIRANFTLAGLSAADLSQADLSEGILDMAHLGDAKLPQATLSMATLKGATLTGADMTEASLNGADLTGARLNGAILVGADLSNANFMKANLAGAVLEGAIVRDDLGLVKLVTHDYLESVGAQGLDTVRGLPVK
ncbi:pentapeptide repeat-containing protein [Arthrobacter psychrochitiniphilus]|uniref:Pentapeptide repeat-containing protein n=1 Tax=Arthrobacter psychrochitiniphilus TaxID=291045 RepID=A0A2V3DRI7_9MICC|nr:pentapeptide repeat-containing protein [Arthrobacter psychrochitiniphilus]NYG17844.1 uncharacterized protein YjbI with pentapeptide repeats [Arthrobacter psychrochitiniphilus]PXA65119.1 hypothetical protein CVS29_10525 [Arthrobacter psychrochitiniphilus]